MTGTLKILITNAASKTVSIFLPMLCSGDVFGMQQKIHLVLFAFKPLIKDLEMLANDINECCFPILERIESTTNMTDAFEGVDLAILMELERNVIGFKTNSILFRAYGLLLNKQANKDVKVLICGRTANTSAFVCSSFSPSIDSKNFTTLAEHLRCFTSAGFMQPNLITPPKPSPVPSGIKVENTGSGGDDDDVVIWGSCESPIVSRLGTDGRFYLERVESNIRTPGCMVVAKSMAEHLRHWLGRQDDTGTRKKTFCMGVVTNGNRLGIDDNLYFNRPVDLLNPTDDLALDDPLTFELKKISDRLSEERDKAIVDCWRVVLPHSHM